MYLLYHLYLCHSYLVVEVNTNDTTQLLEKQITTLVSEQRLLFADATLSST